MSAKLYEFAVIHHPKPKKKDDIPAKSVLVVEPTHILAASEQEATIQASRQIPEEYADRLDEVEIAIRPF